MAPASSEMTTGQRLPLLVTHNVDVARRARRNVVLRDGELICDTLDFHEAARARSSVAQIRGELTARLTEFSPDYGFFAAPQFPACCY